MLVKELIKKLQKEPQDQKIVLLDYRMNVNNANGEGTPEGIYGDFELEEVELGKLDDMEDTFKVTALMFKNIVDYDEDCNKINYDN